MKKLLVAIITLFMLCGCSTVIKEKTDSDTTYDLSFKDEDLDASYDNAKELLLDGEDDVTITEEGNYIISGELDGGSLIVDADDKDEVKLILDGVSINSDDFAAIYVVNASKVTITLNEDTVNTLSDNGTYTQIDDDTVDGVIFSKSDLVINGNGTLNITANYEHGIVSKDDLIITGGTINITSVSSALSGKDCVKIANGNLTLNSNADAIKSTNEEAGKGYIYIIGGNITVNSSADGIYAYNLIDIENGTFVINTLESDSSTKAIKTDSDLVINGGKYTINAVDDGLHAGNSITINDGEINITSSDDGIHSDSDLNIDGGTINIENCKEGLEGAFITVNDGDIKINSSDDGFNAANSNDTSSSTNFQGNSTNATLTINGGTIYVNANGDGLDSNGTITITGGNIIVEGPSDGGNAAFDYETGGFINGGTMICIGNSSMAESMSEDSTQASLLYNFDQMFAAGSTIVVKDADGNEVFNFTASKTFNSILVTSTTFGVDDIITITINDTDYTYTLSSIVNTEGQAGMSFGGGGGKMGGFNQNNANQVTPPSDGDSAMMPSGSGTKPANFNKDDLPEDFDESNLPDDFDPSNMPSRGDGRRSFDQKDA